MSLRRSEDQSLETRVAKWDFLEVTALYLSFKEWRNLEREGVSVRRIGMHKVRKSAKSCTRESKWCHTVAEADEIFVEDGGKREAGKVGWKYTVRAQMPGKVVMILHCRQWETMENIWDKWPKKLTVVAVWEKHAGQGSFKVMSQTNARDLARGRKRGPEIKDTEKGAPGWLSNWASAFSSGRDPGVLGSSPTSGSLHGACFSLCLCVRLSWINKNKILKKKKYLHMRIFT